MSPAEFQRLLETALAHHQKGRWPEAEKLYRQARAAQPKHFDALHLSGALAYQQQRYTDALDLLTKASRINPRSGTCAMRLGLTLVSLGQNQQGEIQLRTAVRTEPQNVDAWAGLAVALRNLGKVEEAIAAYEKVVALEPQRFEAHGLLGALRNETQGAAAIPHFKRALEINPAYAVGWCNLGIAQLAERDFDQALVSLDRALQEMPALAQAHVGRALVFQQTYQLEKALEAFDTALALEPGHPEARSGKLLTLNYLHGPDSAALFEEHRQFGRHAEKGQISVGFSHHRDPAARRLRIGFISPDLRAHSIAYFLEPLLRRLDPAAFEIFLYHDHSRVDAVSERLRGLAQSWKNLVGQPHPAAEKVLRADQLDIAIDLAGHTGFNRLAVFAHRVAPVQITYLGYPNTSGLTAMDFRLVDPITDPEEPSDSDAFYTETRIRFSPCAWAYAPPANAPSPGRTGNPALTFGTFNNPAKLSAQTLALWARLLAAVPDSRLLLKGHGLGDPVIGEVVSHRLRAAGIELGRVELLARTPQLASHLELYHQVDIALDPFPYHGTTTTCEALWMGVPVVSLCGDRHAARVGASLLTAVGHPEWIAKNENDYIEIAVALARDANRRQTIRENLRQEMSASVLLDHAGQAQRFGAALRACWDNLEHFKKPIAKL